MKLGEFLGLFSGTDLEICIADSSDERICDCTIRSKGIDPYKNCEVFGWNIMNIFAVKGVVVKIDDRKGVENK